MPTLLERPSEEALRLLHRVATGYRVATQTQACPPVPAGTPGYGPGTTGCPSTTVVPNLTNGSGYYAVVTAANLAGSGPPTASNGVTPHHRGGVPRPRGLVVLRRVDAGNPGARSQSRVPAADVRTGPWTPPRAGFTSKPPMQLSRANLDFFRAGG